MNQLLIELKQNFLKLALLLIVIFPIMFFLNSGFLIDNYWQVIQAVIFTFVFSIILIWPQLKKAIFLQALIAIFLMVFLYVLGLIEVADMIGSTGFGFIILNLLGYLPQLVKLGYIRKL